MLAQTDDGKALKRRIGIASRINVGQGLIERPVGKIRQPGDDFGQRQMSGQVPDRQGQRQRPLFPPQFLPDIVRFRSGLRAIVERRIEIFRIQQIRQLRLHLEQHLQIGRIIPRPGKRVGKRGCGRQQR